MNRGELSIVRGIPLEEEPRQGALTIPGYLREVTAKYAEREAVVLPGAGGGTRWSYAALWERSVEVARALLACGAGKDARVGILMTNRPEQLAAAFGTSLAGGVMVMLNTFATASELEHLLTTSGVGILLFERHVAGKDFAAMLSELEPAVKDTAPGDLRSTRFPFLRRLAMLDPAGDAEAAGAVETWPDFLRHGDATPPALVEATAASVQPSDAAAVFFSSGTTSLPKGVLHAQRAAAIQWWRWGRLADMTGPVRSWSPNSFFWSGNFSMVLGVTLSVGGAVVLQPVFDPEEAIALLQAEHVTYAHAWPHQWTKLEGTPGWEKADLSALCWVSQETPAAQHPKVQARWGKSGSYGATETLTISTAFPYATPAEVIAGSSGEPLPGNTVKIVDPLSGQVVPRGTSGEICVKGPTLMLGYLGTPLADTLDDEGFFRSGDRGHVDDAGRMFWAGRLTEVIKTGGANVSPLEVDAVLIAHEAVKLSKTVGIPHDTLGELVVACLVLHPGARLDEEAVRAFAREQLASYKVPRRVLFFRDDELEMTGTDKIKTDALREKAHERLKGAHA